MNRIKSRLEELERRSKDTPGSGQGFAKSYPDLVAQVRAEAEIEVEMGGEPDFYVDDSEAGGLVRAAFDGRVIHHVGELLSASREMEKQVDREIRELDGDPATPLEPEEDLEVYRQHEEYFRRVNERLDQWGERGMRAATPGESRG